METKSSGQMQIRAFEYEVKSAEDSGRFSGYASVFGVIDSYNELVAPGAFLKSLENVKAKGRTLPVLWQHRTGDPIGNWDMDTLAEDSHGLGGAGDLWLDDAPYARIAQRGMKSKSITGLSIGYYVRKSSLDEKTRVRTLLELDLVEISVVTNPANDEARVDAIKSKLAHGSNPTLREFEEFLRDAGFSKWKAERIARRGYTDLLSRGDSGTSSAAQMGALRAFNIPK